MIRGLPRDLGTRCMSVAGMRPTDESAVVDVHVHFHWKPKPRSKYYAYEKTAFHEKTSCSTSFPEAISAKLKLMIKNCRSLCKKLVSIMIGVWIFIRFKVSFSFCFSRCIGNFFAETRSIHRSQFLLLLLIKSHCTVTAANGISAVNRARVFNPVSQSARVARDVCGFFRSPDNYNYPSISLFSRPILQHSIMH